MISSLSLAISTIIQSATGISRVYYEEAPAYPPTYPYVLYGFLDDKESHFFEGVAPELRGILEIKVYVTRNSGPAAANDTCNTIYWALHNSGLSDATDYGGVSFKGIRRPIPERDFEAYCSICTLLVCGTY